MNQERSVVIYPNVPTPQLIPLYRAIAPPHNYNYRVGAVPATPENPGGRLPREGVSPGRLIGPNQILARARREWAGELGLAEVSHHVLDHTENLQIRNHPLVQLPQHYLPMNRRLEWTDVLIGADEPSFPNMNAQANAAIVGNSFIARIAITIIGYLRTLNEDVFTHFQGITPMATILDRIQDIPIPTLRLIQRNDLLRDIGLIIEFTMRETYEDGRVKTIQRGVNKYESWFLNPELRINVPGQPRRVGGQQEAFRLLNLSDPHSHMDIYYAVYRWFQLYQLMPYGLSATFVGITLSFRPHNYVVPNIGPQRPHALGIPSPFRALATMDISHELIKAIKFQTYQVKVRCPPTSDNNCFFNAIRPFAKKLHSSYSIDLQTDSHAAIFNSTKDFNAAIKHARNLFKLGPTEAVDIINGPLEKICRYFNVPVIIFNSDMTVMREVTWFEAPPSTVLFYFNAQLCRKHFSKARENCSQVFGHIGIIDSKEEVKFCSLCVRHYWNHHICTELAILQAKRRRQDPQVDLVVATKRPDWQFIHKTKPSPRQGDYDILYYDFETLNAKDKEEFQAYAVGIYYGNTYFEYYGESTMSDFFTFLSTTRVTLAPADKKEVLLVAWNGGRFDAKLILRFAMTDTYWSNKTQISKLLFNGNRILAMTLRITSVSEPFVDSYYSVFDPINFFMCSLKNACADFKVSAENCKKSFPHPIMKTFNDINQLITLQELNNPLNYYPSDRQSRLCLKEPWSEKEVEPFLEGLTGNGTKLYSLRQLSAYYLKADVLGMREVCLSFFDKIWESQKYNCWSYMTVSQMSYIGWHASAPFKNEIMIPPSMECYDMIRKATYGGRVFVGRKEWISPALTPELRERLRHQIYHQQNELDDLNIPPEQVTEEYFQDKMKIQMESHLKYKQLDPAHYLQELDFNSLYPSVMYAYDYPLGEAKFTCDLHSIQETFNVTGALQIGFYSCTYKPPKTLFLACLPQRVKGLLKWDITDGSGFYTSADLENAYLAGYVITLETAWIYPNKGKIFTDYVKKAMDLKKEGDVVDNPALRAYGKLMANSLYGKMLQSMIREVCEIVNTREQADKFFEKNVWEGSMFIGQSVILTGAVPDPDITRPYQLGAFVLAYSRRENWKKFGRIDPSYFQRSSLVFPDCIPCSPSCKDIKDCILNSPIYGDTDSMYVRGNQIGNLDLRNEFLYLKNEDEADYIKKSKKGKPGGVRILWMIAVTVKTYGYVYINSKNELRIKIASKGIQPTLLNFRDFIEASEYFGDIDYRGRLVSLGMSIRGGVSNHTKSIDFSKIFHTNLARTFNKTSQTARVTLDEAFKMDPSGVLTVPVGHVFAKEFSGEADDDWDMITKELNALEGLESDED